MIKSGHLDELQLLKRGNIFKHGLFTIVGLLLANALLHSWGIEWAAGKWEELTIILFVVMVCSIEFICYDIYPLTEKKQRYLIYSAGLLGLAAFIGCIYDLAVEKAGFLVLGKITDSGLGMLYGVMFMAVFLVYKCKAKHNSKRENDE